MAKIQLISGTGAVEEALAECGMRKMFRYRLNVPTIGLVLFFGVLFFLAAGILWFGPGLGGGYTAAFVLAIFIGMSFFSMASFWGNYTNNRFIAVCDEYLFVGGEDRTWQVHWSLVDRESLNMDDLQLSRFRGGMKLLSAGQEIEIPLFTPFVLLEDLEELMVWFLRCLEDDGDHLEAEEQTPQPDAG